MDNKYLSGLWKVLLSSIRQLKVLIRKLVVWRTLKVTCYELGHTWTPHCRQAAFDIFKSALTTGLKVYSTVYLITAILKQRKLSYYTNVVWKDILRSSLFLGANGLGFITCFCACWRVVGCYCYPFTLACAPPLSMALVHIEHSKSHLAGGFDRMNALVGGTLASAFALVAVEQPSRRSTLAMYTANLALETLYNSLTYQKIIPRIPGGEIILFSAALAGFLHYYRKEAGLDKFTSQILSKVFGGDETGGESIGEDHRYLASIDSYLPSSVKVPLYKALAHRHLQLKHTRCVHRWGCLLNVVEKFVRCYGLGYGVGILLNVPQALRLLFSRKNPIGRLLLSDGSFSCAAFLASMSSLHQAVSCLLRWGRGTTNPSMDGIISGAVAGLSMYFYRSSTLALYVFIRLVDLVCRSLADSGQLVKINNPYAYLYAISTGYLIHSAIWQPHTIRPAYWKFVLDVTGQKFGHLNRRLLVKVFGTDSAVLYPDFWPKYDPRYTDLLSPDCLSQMN